MLPCNHLSSKDNLQLFLRILHDTYLQHIFNVIGVINLKRNILKFTAFYNLSLKNLEHFNILKF